MDMVVNCYCRAPLAAIALTPTASPWVYLNASAGLENVNISGGVVSLLEVDAGIGFVPIVGIAGTVLLFPGWSLRTTYVVSAPTATMVQL